MYNPTCFQYHMNGSSESINFFKKNSKLEDYIKIYDNIINDETCDEIVTEYKDSHEWDLGRLEHGRVDSNIRSCDTIYMSTKKSFEFNYTKRKQLDNIIFEKTGDALSRYRKDTCCEFLKFINTDSGYNLLRYREGGFIRQHTDHGKTASRSISLSICLNDNYKGGEFAFFDKELTFNLKKGSAIIFPSNFLYPHEIMSISNGTRYAIVTWFD